MRRYAEWLFGLVAEQPREYRRLLKIRRRIYRKVAPLRAEVVRSAEPIAFDDIPHAAFRPILPGDTWGGVFDCAWLHLTGEVPSGISNPIVMLGIRGEGLVFSPGGEILDAVTTVFQQGDLPHSGGKFRPVRRVDLSNERVDLYADVTHNGFVIYPVGRGRFHGAHLATRDDEAFGLYYDYLTLTVLAHATDDAALARGLRRNLDAAWSDFEAGDISRARAVLAAPLARPSTDDFLYSAVGHGHLDMAWLWPVRETKRKAARTYSRALASIEDRPGYVFGTSQPQQMQWMKDAHPDLFARMKHAVALGRLELQGSFWVETDTNLPGGESLVRQAVIGRRFLQQEFGLTDDDLRLCWLPDTFGYTGALPQILKKSGMDWFQTIKLAWNKLNVHPYRTFHWAGIDGSTVLVHMPPEGDYNSRGAADGLLKGLKQYPEKDLGAALLVFGSGDGGGGPGEIHLEVTARETDLRGLPKVEYSRAGDFFRKLETLEVTHRFDGELYLEAHQGTYTTNAALKKHNRIAERKLHDAEVLAAMTGRPARDELEQYWRDVLLQHFHDILPGSSIARVSQESVEELRRVADELDVYSDARLAELPTSGDEPSALNLSGVPRDEHVRVGDSWFRARVEPYAAAPLEPAEPHPKLRATDDVLSNGILTLRFGRTGEIVSCLDPAGTEHARDGLNRLVLHRDRYQVPWDAWDIGRGYLDRSPRVLRPSSVSTEIDGPTAVRTQVYRFGRSRIEQRVILEAGSPLVRFETRVGWHETHRMLRADFRPTHYGDAAKSEIQFGHIERPTTENGPIETAQFEICAHKWIATETSEGGFAVLNDSKYGHRAKSGLLSLTLLRSPTFPDRTADRGTHAFTYAFRPFAAGDLTGVIRDGYRLNNPLHIRPGVSLPSFATSSDPGVIIETIKPAESGDGVVVRMYESLGRPAVTALRTSAAYSRATVTDLLERPQHPADLERLELGPFEILTIHLENQ
ncbi:glycoside hydrolase family 38 C-terminal domain-containing protein [Pseudolysinimonas sp.]|uniref:alpha-mannosidase n=1 Tax=Pseudolysinimonas sp. TaxID=2680009 RepID=UPI00286CA035|nr:glycoside hydrolase family 38 C-terminal domain-containing protein [Pseudolysinimonas sp.]